MQSDCHSAVESSAAGFDPTPEPRERDDSLQNVVELSKLQFWWSTAAAPVIDIDALSVARGERVFLRGPSGSGKSTLLSLIAGVVNSIESEAGRLLEHLDMGRPTSWASPSPSSA